jgi:drug/metabolite transporter (DMT)-like permease
MKGHLLALIAITIWSLTYIQTKVLLAYIDPIEILMVRFSLAWVILWIIYPKRVSIYLKDEVWFMLAGLSMFFGYYVLENFALIHTTAINAGLLVTMAPLFTLLISSIVHHTRIPKKALYGAFISFIGVAVLVFDKISLPNVGDGLALLAGLGWAIYTLVLDQISSSYHYLAVTRKSIFYGLVFLWIFWETMYSGVFHIEAYSIPVVLINFTTLIIFASVSAYIFWRKAVLLIGASTTSNYIYLVPLINTTASVWVLNEALGWRIVLSSVLILGGLITVNRRSHQMHEQTHPET